MHWNLAGGLGAWLVYDSLDWGILALLHISHLSSGLAWAFFLMTVAEFRHKEKVHVFFLSLSLCQVYHFLILIYIYHSPEVCPDFLHSPTKLKPYNNNFYLENRDDNPRFLITYFYHLSIHDTFLCNYKIFFY